MSDNSSNTENTRSAAEIRQDITDYVLKHVDEMSDVPGVKQFVEEHGRLTKEIAEANERAERLAKAKEEYEPLENRVTARRKALKDAEAELAEMHRPLGTAAFQSFLDGDIEDQPLFADRLAAHKKIQELQQERDNLAPDADAGIALKAKAKAQQLAITGKIKLEEMQLGGLETEVGRKAVEDKLDESVRCDSTAERLRKITDNRESLSACSSKLQEADAAQEKAARQLCEAVPLTHIDNTKTFDTKMKKCKKHVRESESSLANTTRLLTEELAQADPSALPDAMAQQMGTLKEASQHDVSERMRNAGNQMRERGAGVLSTLMGKWSGLSRQGRIKVFVGACGVFLVLIVVGGLESDWIPESTHGDDGGVPVATSNRSGDGASSTPSDLAPIEPYDFSEVDYSSDSSKLDYSLIPSGASKSTVTRRVPSSENADKDNETGHWETTDGYKDSTGAFVRHGLRTLFSDEAQSVKAITDTWYQGKRNGPWKLWGEHGKPKAEAAFVEDRQHGIQTRWLSGEIISERYFYKGELHGPEVERYKDGTKRNETAWVAGKEHGVGKRWHPNGAIYKTTYLDHGKIIGVLRWWHPDGTKELEKGYVNGKKHGLASEWYRNGQTAFQGEYVDGMKQGIIKEWHHNGQMRCEAEYVDGKKHGLWKRWYDNGTVREQWEYAKGSIVYSRPARVGHFLAKLQEVVSDGQYPVGFRCDYDEFMGVFGEPQGKQQKLRANVGRWTFDCSDGSVSLNEVTVGGTSVLLVKGLDTIRLRNLITENMSKGGFAKKIKEDRHSVHISWNYEEWLTAFGYPSVDSTLGRDHEKLWIYRCRDGNIMLTIEHTWNVSNGKILLPNRLMVKEIDY